MKKNKNGGLKTAAGRPTVHVVVRSLLSYGLLMAMPFDEALKHPGPLIAAWNLNADPEGVRLSLFSLEGGAQQLAVQWVPEAEKGAAVRPLREAGIPVGSYDTWCRFVWLRDDPSFTVWSFKERVFTTDTHALFPRDGEPIPRSEIVTAFSWVDVHGLLRGVSVELQSGACIQVASEIPLLQEDSPSRTEILFTSHWATIMARDLAKTLGVAFQNRI